MLHTYLSSYQASFSETHASPSLKSLHGLAQIKRKSRRQSTLYVRCATRSTHTVYRGRNLHAYLSSNKELGLPRLWRSWGGEGFRARILDSGAHMMDVFPPTAPPRTSRIAVNMVPM